MTVVYTRNPETRMRAFRIPVNPLARNDWIQLTFDRRLANLCGPRKNEAPNATNKQADDCAYGHIKQGDNSTDRVTRAVPAIAAYGETKKSVGGCG